MITTVLGMDISWQRQAILECGKPHSCGVMRTTFEGREPRQTAAGSASRAAIACFALTASHSSMRWAGSSGCRPVCLRSWSIR